MAESLSRKPCAKPADFWESKSGQESPTARSHKVMLSAKIEHSLRIFNIASSSSAKVGANISHMWSGFTTRRRTRARGCHLSLSSSAASHICPSTRAQKKALQTSKTPNSSRKCARRWKKFTKRLIAVPTNDEAKRPNRSTNAPSTNPSKRAIKLGNAWKFVENWIQHGRAPFRSNHADPAHTEVQEQPTSAKDRTAQFAGKIMSN